MRTTLCAVGTLYLLTASCKQPKEETEAVASAGASVASAVPAPPPAPPPELSPADTVGYLPQKCMARAYIDVENMREHPKVSAQLARILSRTLSRNAQTKEALELMNSTLKGGGLSLPDDALGFGVCVQSADKWISVVTLDVKDVEGGPLELIQRTINVPGGPDFAAKNEGKLRYLSAEDTPGVLSFVAPGVLAVGSDPQMLAHAAGKPGKADAFGRELDELLLAGRFSLGPENQAKLYLEELDGAIRATLDASLSKEQTAKAVENRQKFTSDVKKALAAELGELDTEELKALAARVNDASIEINDNRVRATLSISEEGVAGLIATLAEATPDSLVKEVDWHLP